MASLSYREGQIEQALQAFSPKRQLLFAWLLCRRLLDLIELSESGEQCLNALDLAWRIYLSNGDSPGEADSQALAQASMAVESQQRNVLDVQDILANLAQEGREAVLVLLDSCRHPENRLDDCRRIVRISRECVENLAQANLQAAQWDPNLDEKIRSHPLVQQELADLYGDLQQIWAQADNPEGYRAVRFPQGEDQ